MVIFSRMRNWLTAIATLTFGCCLVAALPGCKSKQFDSMEAPAGCIETLVDTLTTPTVGLRGIDLTPGIACKFKIDREVGSWLKWDDFHAMFHPANIMVSLYIDSVDGSWERWIAVNDGLDPSALDAIQQVMQTWRWSGGCYYGEICFVFNTTGSRIYIDDSRLIEKPGCGEGNITRERLHLIYYDNPLYSFSTHPRRICPQ